MAVRKSALYGSLWASCDQLRGGMDASQYKDYVLVLLFMKYVSDRYADDPDAPIVVPDGGSFADMLAARGSKDVGDQINKIIARLAEANGTLSGIVTAANFNDEEKLGRGQEMVERLTNLLNIFARPELDFAGNDAEGDDLLGDAYEYLMRHFATQSGKSKGQFYTPAEVSRIIAHLVGAPRAKGRGETVYDPTCGSGSLLLKVQAAAPHGLTVYGQEKDNATRALAVMNMVLHGDATAEIELGNTLAAPKSLNGEGGLRTFDYVVANPPFSDKAWRNGVVPDGDPRFRLGVPPAKQGDYAYLLHVLASMKSRARAVVVMPHGVLFRGNAEGDIRRELVRRGLIAGLVGLPANLFYGTGIPACLIVLDKARAAGSPIMMIDASRGFVKDGPKNRLRHQDVHCIVDTYERQAEVPCYARLVSLSEVERNGFNLNLPRYIDAGSARDRHDIAAHLFGGVPGVDVDAFADWWAVAPALRDLLFRAGERAGSLDPAVGGDEVRGVVLGSEEVAAFADRVRRTFADWRAAHEFRLEAIAPGDQPTELIHALSEDLLARFRPLPLVDPYDVYQRLMGYWDEVMGDDVGLLARDGWAAARRIGPPGHDEVPDIVLPGTGRAKLRYKAELIPPRLVVVRFFAEEAAALSGAEADADALDAEVEALAEAEGGDEGALGQALDDKDRLSEKLVKTRVAEIGREVGGASGRGRRKAADDAVAASEFADEWAALHRALDLLARAKAARATAKALRQELDRATVARYAELTQAEARDLVVRDKWLADLEAAVMAEPDRSAAALAARVRTLIERYRDPLPNLVRARDAATGRVRDHLAAMGFAWS